MPCCSPRGGPNTGARRNTDPKHTLISLLERRKCSPIGGAVLVGINVDDTRGGERPAHSLLLAAGIAIVEHLTGLEPLVGRPFRFSAVPAKVKGLGSWPVRAFAEFGMTAFYLNRYRRRSSCSYGA